MVDPGNFQRCAEIAALDGSSSGIFVDDYNQFFRVGDILMLQLYDGTVKSIPDFTIQAPALTVPASGTIASTIIQYTMNQQFRDSGSVITPDLYFDDGQLTSVRKSGLRRSPCARITARSFRAIAATFLTYSVNG